MLKALKAQLEQENEKRKVDRIELDETEAFKVQSEQELKEEHGADEA